MNNKSQKILVAAAWPYVNGDIHIGHLVGYFIPADLFTRYNRFLGHDVLFVSGADCHGTPITVEADKRGISAAELVKEYIPKVHQLIDLYDIKYSLFTATTTQNHKEVTQEFFLNLLENGYIIKEKSLQYYSETESKFLPDRYVEGECPHCHAKDQRADQCENCGRSLGLGELINPKSKLTKSEVTLKETEHYFIDFAKLEPQIKEYVLAHEDVWKSWVWKETIGWLNEGLKPRAITRDLDWGVEIPKDRIPENLQIENIDSKKFYVWFEAVIGYYSAAKEYCDANGLDLKEYWNNPEARHYYFMGQDNLTFHTIFWPGQLIGQEKGYNLPTFPAIVKFLNANGAKLSKSRGNVIDAKEIGEKFGTDLVRFYLLSILPENKEGNWDWKDFASTINSELNGNIGNFIHRSLTFYKNKLGKFENSNLQLEEEVKNIIDATITNITQSINEGRFVDSLDSLKKLSKFGNQYFDKNKPWEVLKTDRKTTELKIYNCIILVNAIRILFGAFLPKASDTLSGFLSLDKVQDQKLPLENYVLSVDQIKVSDNLLPLFKKIEDEEISKSQS